MPEETATKASLTEGPIGPALRSLALPMGFGIIFLILVNLVDTFFVGQLGVGPLAAMSFTFPVITLVMSVALGLGVGATSAIARAIGHGDEAIVKRLTTHAMLLSLVVVGVVSTVGILTQDMIFRALGAEEALLPMLEDYMTIWFLGSVFLVVPIVANGALRASGDARTPATLMLVAAVVNFILDPIFIFGFGPVPRLELEGAAIATLISRAVVMCFTIYMIGVRRKMLDLHVPSVSELLDSWRQIVSVGAPAALSNALGPIAAGVITSFIALEGSSAVAAYGIGTRVESLVLIAPIALSTALSPFIGQNWGAHLGDRVAQAVKLSLGFVILWGVGALVVLELVAGPLAGLFSEDKAVVDALETYMRVLPIGYAAYGVVSVANAAFNAVDRAVRATLIAAARGLLLAVPLAWGGSLLFGLRGIYLGLVVAAFLAALLSVRWLSTLLKPESHAAVEVPAEASVEKTAAFEGISEGLTEKVRQLIAEIGALEGVVSHPCRGNALGFFIGQREIGHIHKHGHIDLPFAPLVRDQLVGEGRVAHHRNIHDSCWVTHRLQDAADVAEATWLLRLAHAHYELCARGPESPITQGELGVLELSDELLQRLKQSAELGSASVG